MSDTSKENMQKLMAKALKSSEPVMFMGREILLKKLTFSDDIIIQSLINDVYSEATATGVDPNVLDRIILTTQILAHVKMTAFEKTGEPVYATMDDIGKAVKNPEVIKAVNDLFVQYMTLMELSQAEKKS